MPAHRILLPAALLLLGVATGCSATHGPEEDIASGLYDLEIRRVSDGCSPERLTGSLGEVPVVSHDGLLSVPVPERDDEPGFEVSRRVTLLETEGFHFALEGEMAECPGAVTRHEWTVVERSATHFAVEHLQRFEGLSSCGPMDDAPVTDCEAVRELRFELRSRCDAPCELTWSPATGVACTCY